ncbi:MAG: hypothetical protein ACF8QF_05155 [Phycisphaerales bacterium]
MTTPLDDARLQEALRATATLRTPDSLRVELFERIAQEDAPAPIRFPRRNWIAAAAVITLAVTSALVIRPWRVGEPTQAEVAEAAAQLRLVLAGASRAMRDTPAHAIEQTLTEGVRPAIRRTPLTPDTPGI